MTSGYASLARDRIVFHGVGDIASAREIRVSGALYRRNTPEGGLFRPTATRELGGRMRRIMLFAWLLGLGAVMTMASDASFAATKKILLVTVQGCDPTCEGF